MGDREIVLFGHVTDDLVPDHHIGGGGSYSSVALKRLGNPNVKLVTKAPFDHRYLQELSRLGIEIYNLPVRDVRLSGNITSFVNLYSDGRRRQAVLQAQEEISKDDLAHFPQLSENPVIFVNTVIDEVDVDLFPELARRGDLVVAAQGYFRNIGEDGVVTRASWKDVDALGFAKLVILSDEDITFNGGVNQDMLAKIREVCPVLVLTEGEKGLTIFEQGKEKVHIDAFPLTERELKSKDLTGAGDTAAAAFISEFYGNHSSLKEAGVSAALVSALKIARVGGEEGGLYSIPTFQQVREFSLHNHKRVESFYRENGLAMLSSLEGNHMLKERQ